MKSKRSLRPLLTVLAAAAFMRVHAALVTPVVSKDALWFVTGAQAISQGRYDDWLRGGQHPLEAALVWLGGRLAGDWIRGGQIVNVLLGVLAVLPVYGAARLVFGARAALCAGWLFAFHVRAVRYAGDVLSEPSCLLFFLSAVFFGLLALRTNRKRWFALCGACSGAAYLARPEGLGPALAAAAWAALQSPRRLLVEARPRAARVLVLALAAALVAGPYMLYIGGLTQKKRLSEIIEAKPVGSPQPSTSVPGKSQMELVLRGGGHKADLSENPLKFHLAVAYEVASKVMAALPHMLAPLVLLGLFVGAARRREAVGQGYLLSLVLLYLFVLYGLRASSGYVSRRHAAAIAMLCLLWAGAGLDALAAWLARRPQWRWGLPRARAALLVVAAVAMSAEAVEPQNTHRRGEAQAGLWIRSHCPGQAKVVTLELPRVACYAYSRDHRLHEAFLVRRDGAFVPDPKRFGYWGVLDYALRIGATHVAFDERKINRLLPRFMADLRRAAEQRAVPRLAERARFKVKPRDPAPCLVVCEVVRKAQHGPR